MLDKLDNIYNSNISHNNFSDKPSIKSCMIESYNLGKSEKLNNFVIFVENLLKKYENSTEIDSMKKELSEYIKINYNG